MVEALPNPTLQRTWSSLTLGTRPLNVSVVIPTRAQMKLTEDIGRALVEQRGFTAVKDAVLPDGSTLEIDAYGFVGVRPYWGSMLACGLLAVRGEDDERVSRRAEEFFRFSSSLREFAGSVNGTRLGGFGLLVIISDGPTSPRFRKVVASQKRGSAWRKDYCLVWLLDHALRRVHRHRGFPLAMYPGRRFFESLLVDRGTAG
jgi:hypothetical protein